MLPVERVIGDSGLESSAHGTRLAVRLPWYRSLPLSTVKIEHLAIDGVAIAPEELRFDYAARSLSLAELADSTNDFWFVLDSAFLLLPSPLPVGSTHEVDLTISLYPPYIPGMKRANRETASLTVGGVQ